MKALEMLERLRGSKKAVFTSVEIARLIRKERAYVKIFAHRLERKGLLARIEKGKYVLKDASPLSIASGLVYPSYVSFLAALAHYGLTTQIPRKICVVSLRQKAKIDYKGTAIEFVKVKPSRFFGFERETIEGKLAWIADREKAVIDSLCFPEHCPVSEVFFALSGKELDSTKILEYAVKMRSPAAAQRLGYLLERVGIDAEAIRSKIGRKRTLLNPTGKKYGDKNNKWRLIVNEVLE